MAHPFWNDDLNRRYHDDLHRPPSSGEWIVALLAFVVFLFVLWLDS